MTKTNLEKQIRIRTFTPGLPAKVRFVDSADAVCERETGGVNGLCRDIILSR